ncbi:GAF domain-containing protein [Spirosoma arcticum]
MQPDRNIYTGNALVGATPNPLMPTPGAANETFAQTANELAQLGVELLRHLIGAHQSAIAIVTGQDWRYVRKFFSLSEKYQAWAGYDTPATGYGSHGWLLSHNQPVRFTQAELEQHQAWKNFGLEAGKHPPMRGWMAAPIRDRKGTNWELLQLSDRYEGDFKADDEVHFLRYANTLSLALELAWEVRNLAQQNYPSLPGSSAGPDRSACGRPAYPSSRLECWSGVG